jgi:hypothetical protein
MAGRSVEVDHSSLNRWVLKYTPALEKVFRQRKHAVGASWRMDERYISVKVHWTYLYRAVDKDGNTIDFLPTHKRDRNPNSSNRCRGPSDRLQRPHGSRTASGHGRRRHGRDWSHMSGDPGSCTHVCCAKEYLTTACKATRREGRVH